MELRHLRYFSKAAELLHFTHAAQALYISQPTLSTHIQQLEEEVGTPLFDRVGRNVQLTEAGKRFLFHAQRALQDLDAAKERIQALKKVEAGTLYIGSLLTFGQELLPAWIASFRRAYPGIHIVVKSANSDFIEEEVVSGRIDVALSFVPPTNEELQHEELFAEDVCLTVANDHPLARKKSIDSQELCEIPLALVSRRLAARRWLDSQMASKNLKLNVQVEMDDLQALLRIASQSNLGTVLTALTSPEHANLKMIPLANLGKVRYGILWNRHSNISPCAQAFLDHIKQQGKPHHPR